MNRFAIFLIVGIALFTGCSNTVQEERYTIEQSTENGDTIVDEEGEVANLDKLLRFVDQVEKGRKSEVTVSNFFNNQVSVNVLAYDGNQVSYMLKTGSGEEKMSTICDRIEEKSGFISLQACEGDEETIGIVQVSEYEINRTKASMKE